MKLTRLPCWQCRCPGQPSPVPENTPVPGGVAVIDLGPVSQPTPTALGEQALAVVKDSGRWFALFGIPLETVPGETKLAFFRGRPWPIRRWRCKKAYPEQRLTIRTSARSNQRRRPGPHRSRARRSPTPSSAASSDGMPTPTSRAGRSVVFALRLRRIFNGQPRNLHVGLDVAVGTGPVRRRPRGGQYTGDYFFNSNTVFVDHGQG